MEASSLNARFFAEHKDHGIEHSTSFSPPALMHSVSSSADDEDSWLHRRFHPVLRPKTGLERLCYLSQKSSSTRQILTHPHDWKESEALPGNSKRMVADMSTTMDSPPTNTLEDDDVGGGTNRYPHPRYDDASIPSTNEPPVKRMKTQTMFTANEAIHEQRRGATLPTDKKASISIFDFDLFVAGMLAFKKAYRHVLVPFDYIDPKTKEPLGTWLHTVRRDFLQNWGKSPCRILTRERVDSLNRLGVEWTLPESRPKESQWSKATTIEHDKLDEREIKFLQWAWEDGGGDQTRDLADWATKQIEFLAKNQRQPAGQGHYDDMKNAFWISLLKGMRQHKAT